MSNELHVKCKGNSLNGNERSFQERKEELERLDAVKANEKKRESHSPFKNFVQVNKATYKLEDKLMQENPLAYRIWRFLVNNMDHYNAIIASYSVLMEQFDTSRSTLYRAIKVLENGEYIKIYKSGTSNVYALNDKMVWNSYGTNLKYSKFSANVLISESEQDEEIQKTIKTKKEKTLKLE
ncbi:helix-turn-helix domain-containing protein [Senegalia sp. (in: firmicutes)]|uniref:helix-turn-helix domain-containing protein n=1 Tax=Senegalia sp. (in: firmicutes) TaxID=1924098 RepID=UPI003F949172